MLRVQRRGRGPDFQLLVDSKIRNGLPGGKGGGGTSTSFSNSLPSAGSTSFYPVEKSVSRGCPVLGADVLAGLCRNDPVLVPCEEFALLPVGNGGVGGCARARFP